MDKITELASNERRARIALACMTEPADAVRGRLVRKVGAVETPLREIRVELGIGLLDRAPRSVRSGGSTSM